MIQKLDSNINWSEYFSLCAVSPSGLARTKSYTGKSVESYHVGTRLFRKNKSALAWMLAFRGKSYTLHRVIWVLTYGSIDPELVIDHLDGNPFNNSISNLCLKTQADNARNQRRFITNTTGITGVTLTNNGQGHSHYTANWREIDGSLKRKYFSIAKLGESVAKELAKNYRDEQIARLILEGADYTSRHGN